MNDNQNRSNRVTVNWPQRPYNSAFGGPPIKAFRHADIDNSLRSEPPVGSTPDEIALFKANLEIEAEILAILDKKNGDDQIVIPVKSNYDQWLEEFNLKASEFA